jgi:hypothetical protein
MKYLPQQVDVASIVSSVKIVKIVKPGKPGKPGKLEIMVVFPNDEFESLALRGEPA